MLGAFVLSVLAWEGNTYYTNYTANQNHLEVSLGFGSDVMHDPACLPSFVSDCKSNYELPLASHIREGLLHGLLGQSIQREMLIKIYSYTQLIYANRDIKHALSDIFFVFSP